MIIPNVHPLGRSNSPCHNLKRVSSKDGVLQSDTPTTHMTASYIISHIILSCCQGPAEAQEKFDYSITYTLTPTSCAQLTDPHIQLARRIRSLYHKAVWNPRHQIPNRCNNSSTSLDSRSASKPPPTAITARWRRRLPSTLPSTSEHWVSPCASLSSNEHAVAASRLLDRSLRAGILLACGSSMLIAPIHSNRMTVGRANTRPAL